MEEDSISTPIHHSFAQIINGIQPTSSQPHSSQPNQQHQQQQEGVTPRFYCKYCGCPHMPSEEFEALEQSCGERMIAAENYSDKLNTYCTLGDTFYEGKAKKHGMYFVRCFHWNFGD
jgi:hypothetical protein